MCDSFLEIHCDKIYFLKQQSPEEIWKPCFHLVTGLHEGTKKKEQGAMSHIVQGDTNIYNIIEHVKKKHGKDSLTSFKRLRIGQNAFKVPWHRKPLHLQHLGLVLLSDFPLFSFLAKSRGWLMAVPIRF